MNISFEQLKSMVVFAQIIEQGSLSAAAKHIGLTRAVVSYHLKKLESHLGVTLLNRSTRSFTLTEAGQQYYEHCRNIAEQAEIANQQIENLKQEPEGLLKITCPVDIGMQIMVPALNEFRCLYPKIELDVLFTDDVVNIIQEGIDLAIRGAPINDSGLQAIKLSTFSMCLCASPEYFKKKRRPKTPAELNDHQWVKYALASNTLTLEKGKKSYNIKINSSITTNNALARNAFIEGGNGLGCILANDALPLIKKGQLESVLDDYNLPEIEIYGVFPPGSTGAKKLRLLIDYLKEYFNKSESRLNSLIRQGGGG